MAPSKLRAICPDAPAAVNVAAPEPAPKFMTVVATVPILPTIVVTWNVPVEECVIGP